MKTKTHVVFDNDSLANLLKPENIRKNDISENDIIFLEGDAQGDRSTFIVIEENDRLIAKIVLDYEPELDSVNLEKSQSKKRPVTKIETKSTKQPKSQRKTRSMTKSKIKTRSMTKSKIKTRSMKKSKSKKKPTPP